MNKQTQHMTMAQNVNSQNNAIVFPNNIRGLRQGSMNWVAEGESNIIQICVEYHGRYEDDDCYGMFYNLETKEFTYDGWTTRGYCGDTFWKRPVVDINDCSPETVDIVRRALRIQALQYLPTISGMVTSYLTRKYPKSYSRKTRKEVEHIITTNLLQTIYNMEDIPTLVSMFYNDYDGYQTDEIFERWVDQEEIKTGIEVKTEIVRKPSPVKVYGDNYTGKVVIVSPFQARYGKMWKVAIALEDGHRIFTNLAKEVNLGEVITINGVVEYENERNTRLIQAKRIDNVDPELIVRG